MSVARKPAAERICVTAAVLMLMLSAGCGGGASGTGIQGAVYQAQVVDANGMPVAGATVINQQTGEAVTTDETGHFSISLDSSAESNTIEVGGSVPEATIEVPTDAADGGLPVSSGAASADSPGAVQIVGSVFPPDSSET